MPKTRGRKSPKKESKSKTKRRSPRKTSKSKGKIDVVVHKAISKPKPLSHSAIAPIIQDMTFRFDEESRMPVGYITVMVDKFEKPLRMQVGGDETSVMPETPNFSVPEPEKAQPLAPMQTITPATPTALTQLEQPTVATSDASPELSMETSPESSEDESKTLEMEPMNSSVKTIEFTPRVEAKPDFEEGKPVTQQLESIDETKPEEQESGEEVQSSQSSLGSSPELEIGDATEMKEETPDIKSTIPVLQEESKDDKEDEEETSVEKEPETAPLSELDVEDDSPMLENGDEEETDDEEEEEKPEEQETDDEEEEKQSSLEPEEEEKPEEQEEPDMDLEPSPEPELPVISLKKLDEDSPKDDSKKSSYEKAMFHFNNFMKHIRDHMKKNLTNLLPNLGMESEAESQDKESSESSQTMEPSVFSSVEEKAEDMSESFEKLIGGKRRKRKYKKTKKHMKKSKNGKKGKKSTQHKRRR